MKFLHVLKEADSREALEVIKGQASSSGREIGVVLIQGAGDLTPNLPANVFILKRETAGQETGTPGKNELNYETFLDLIFDAEKVAVW